MNRVGCQNDFIVALKKKNLASFGMRKKLNERQDEGHDSHSCQQHVQRLNRFGALRTVGRYTVENDCGKDQAQDMKDSVSADLIPLHYNHDGSSRPDDYTAIGEIATKGTKNTKK